MAKPKEKRNGASRKTGKPKPRTGNTSPQTRKPKPRAANVSPLRKKASSVAKKSTAAASRPQPVLEPRRKTEACLALLVRPEGASLAELQRITGWLRHSVRGFLSGTVKKIRGASLTSEKAGGERRYFLRRAT